jgi:hypothetical protein
MTSLIARALIKLVWLEYLMSRTGLPGIVRSLPPIISKTRTRWSARSEDICRAMDIACVLYVKPVLCLQRSAATVTLLHEHAFPAELVIGARIVPFESHAWVELDGTVVNDKPYVTEIYSELDRC